MFCYREPGTPLLEFYSTGRYPKDVLSVNRLSGGKPGLAANIVERNEERREIKPQIRCNFDISSFKPSKYLNSKKEHFNMTDNLHLARHENEKNIVQLKKSIADKRGQVPLHGGNTFES